MVTGFSISTHFLPLVCQQILAVRVTMKYYGNNHKGCNNLTVISTAKGCCTSLFGVKWTITYYILNKSLEPFYFHILRGFYEKIIIKNMNIKKRKPWIYFGSVPIYHHQNRTTGMQLCTHPYVYITSKTTFFCSWEPKTEISTRNSN